MNFKPWLNYLLSASLFLTPTPLNENHPKLVSSALNETNFSRYENDMCLEERLEASIPPPSTNLIATANKYQGLIILDPGHGGIDTGAVVNGIAEDEIAYDIAIRTRQLLLNQSYRVYQTVVDRKTAYQPSDVINPNSEEYLNFPEGKELRLRKRYLEKRCKLINQLSAAESESILVSIHVNETKSYVRGASFYFPSAQKYKSLNAEEKSKKLAYDILDAFKKFKVPVYSLRFLGFNWEIAEKVRDLDRGKNFSLAIFRLTNLEEKILVEVGNLQNSLDFHRLNQPKERQLIAQAIYEGIKKYTDGTVHQK